LASSYVTAASPTTAHFDRVGGGVEGGLGHADHRHAEQGVDVGAQAGPAATTNAALARPVDQ
jgi:hypothetical protein